MTRGEATRDRSAENRGAPRFEDITPTGAFTHEVPIEVPEGRQGMQPALSLSYHSDGGNGLLGVGWSLRGIPAIGRAFGDLGVNYDATDTFVYLENGWGSRGSRDSWLIVGNGGRASKYIFDGSMFEAAGTCGGGPCYWIKHDGKGKKWYFGGDASNNASTAPSFPYVIWEPDNGATSGRGIETWGLYKQEDADGNYVFYEYRDTPQTLYPRRIRYTLKQNTTTDVREVEFNYQTRPDHTPYPFRSGLRLSQIRITSKTLPVRCYELGYEVSGASGRSRLTTVRDEYECHTGSPEAQTIGFGWSDGGQSPATNGPLGPVMTYGFDFVDVGEDTGPTTTHVADVNGDGLADLVRFNPGFRSDPGVCGPCGMILIEQALSNGNGFDPPQTIHDERWINRTTAFRSVTGDINGDSFDDLILFHAGGGGISFDVNLGSPTGLLEPMLVAEPYFVWPIADPPETWNLATGDFNGDQRMDLVFYTTLLPNPIHPTRRPARVQFFGTGAPEYPLGLTPGIFEEWDAAPDTEICEAVSGENGPVLTQSADYCLDFVGASVHDADNDGRDDLFIQWTAVLFERNIPDGRLRIAHAFGGDNGLGPMEDTWVGLGARLAFAAGPGDINGDQRTDLLLTNTGITNSNYPLGREIYGIFNPVPASIFDILIQSPISYAAPLPGHPATWVEHAGDVDGDGLADLVHIYRGFQGTDLDVNFGNPTGGFDQINPWDGAFHVIDDTTSEVDGTDPDLLWRSGLGDVNGDGNADLVMMLYGNAGLKVQYLLGTASNQGTVRGFEGTTFRTLIDQPSYAENSDPRLADVNGDGKSDILLITEFSRPFDSPPTTNGRLRYALSIPDPTDVLITVFDQRGGTTGVQYELAPRTPARVVLDQREARPIRPVAINQSGSLTVETHDPSPQKIVKRITRNNGHTLTRAIRYEYDNARVRKGPRFFRESLGFERVFATEEDTQKITERRYEQDEYLTGLLRESTIHFPRPIWATDHGPNATHFPARIESNLWEYAAAPTGGFGIIRTLRRTTEAERRGTGLVSQVTTDFDYDAYGNEEEAIECATPDDTTGACIITEHTYTNDPLAWTIGRTDSEKISNLNGLILDWRIHRYHSGAFFKLQHTDRLYFSDADLAHCTVGQTGEPCANEVTAGTARWVRIVRNRTYDQYGNRYYEEDAFGRGTSWTHDPDWQALEASVTNDLGHVTQTIYDFAGRKERTIDANNQATRFVHDGMRGVKEIHPPLAGIPAQGTRRIERIDWGGLGQRTKYRNHASAADFGESEDWFDAFGRVYRHIEPDHGDGSAWTFSHESYFAAPDGEYVGANILEKVERVSRPAYCRSELDCDPVTWIETRYDILGRPRMVEQVSPDGSRKRLALYQYAALAPVNSDSDPARWAQARAGECTMKFDVWMQRSVECRDPRGRLIAFGRGLYEEWIVRLRSEPWDSGYLPYNLRDTTYVTYDPAGRPRTITRPSGGTITLTYDSWGRKRSEYDPAFGTKTYEYDDAGDLRVTRDAFNRRTDLDYDAIHRIEEVRNAEETIDYDYDDPTVPNSIGRLTSVAVTAMTKRVLEYDAVGRVVRREIEVPPGTLEYQFAYDWLDRMHVKNFPDGSIQETIYQPGGGRVSQVSLDGVKLDGPINYSATGRIVAIQGGNGAVETRHYDADDRLEEQRVEVGGDPLIALRMVYYGAGNVESIVDLRPDTKFGGKETSRAQTFEYDPLYRLTKATGIYGTLEYDYDAIGDMTLNASRTQVYSSCPGGWCVEVLEPGGLLRYRAVHDVRGDLVEVEDFGSGQVWSNTWNIAGRLIYTQNGSSSASYRYDEAGNRFAKYYAPQLGAAVNTYYVEGDFELREESTSAGQYATTKKIQAGGRLIATVTGGFPLTPNYSCDVTIGPPPGTVFHHSDHLGSPNVLSGANGTALAHYVYEPFGRLHQDQSIGCDSSPLKFSGKELDETGWYYFGARYYDVRFSRFISADGWSPLSGGEAAFAGERNVDPQLFNRFAFVVNNPLRFVDPSGQKPEDAAAAESQEKKPPPIFPRRDGKDKERLRQLLKKSPSPDGAEREKTQNPNDDEYNRIVMFVINYALDEKGSPEEAAKWITEVRNGQHVSIGSPSLNLALRDAQRYFYGYTKRGAEDATELGYLLGVSTVLQKGYEYLKAPVIGTRFEHRTNPMLPASAPGGEAWYRRGVHERWIRYRDWDPDYKPYIFESPDGRKY